jgi:hypothetical protein
MGRGFWERCRWELKPKVGNSKKKFVPLLLLGKGNILKWLQVQGLNLHWFRVTIKPFLSKLFERI